MRDITCRDTSGEMFMKNTNNWIKSRASHYTLTLICFNLITIDIIFIHVIQAFILFYILFISGLRIFL